MLNLSYEGIKDKEKWLEKGIKLPLYDIDEMRKATVEEPIWIHFGAGNIFRGFIASLQQKLLNEGLTDKGIIAADTFDYDMLDRIYRPFDNLTLNVGLCADGSTRKEVIASVADNVKGDFCDEKEKNKLCEIAKAPSLQMMSFTITEKGYSLRGMDKEFMPVVKEDMKGGPSNPRHAMSVVSALLYQRFLFGAYPIALCSMDNCSRNGEKLKESVLEIVNAWRENGFVNDEFVSYVSDESKVSFPWSMIDKITPRPAKSIEEDLSNLGVKDMEPVITNKNTYIAPFVNAEIPEYLVVEDRFPNGRPPLEKAGVYLTDRETVQKSEAMKVTTCLNPLHTAMAVFGCLLGFNHIASEIKDEDIKKLVTNIGYKEGLPVVINPGIISPKDFIDEVVNERLPNMFLPDMPQRIATDTSMKIPIRFGETIKAYANDKDRNVNDLTFIPLAIAAWFRYLLGMDDEGNVMEVSADPRLSELQNALSEVKYDDVTSYKGQLLPILSNETIFASNLVEIGLSHKIEEMFVKMLSGKGAVRKTLHEYVS